MLLYTYNQMQRQEDLYIQYQPSLHNEFEACQSYMVKLLSQKTNQQLTKKALQKLKLTTYWRLKYKVAPVQATAFTLPSEKQLLCIFLIHMTK